MKTGKRKPVAKSSVKKRYHLPKLVAYGALRRLTKVKGGNMNDGGGKPMTKASGGNA